MKQLLFITSVVLLLSSCTKDEFEPKSVNNFIDTTFYFNPTINSFFSFNYYPNYNLTLDGTVNDSSATYLWSPNGETTSSIIVNQPGSYFLNYSSDSTGSLQIEIYLEDYYPVIYITNSFTPNSDGLNDKWKPLYSVITSIHYEVRDNEGIKLFSTDDLESGGWDGKYNDVAMPSGFYLYYINYSTLTTENNILTGSLELIR
jgi:gliding motility-associated-like protein